MNLINVKNLTKKFRISQRETGLSGAVKGLFHRRYRDITALDRISFDVRKGEIIGYIGPNGAGKSTTIKILAGILVPDSGEVFTNGQIPWKNRVETVRKIGVVFGQRTQLWWDLPVGESFDLLAGIYSIPSSVYSQNLKKLTEFLSLKPLIDIPVRQLSLGQRMRCDLAASLLHDPQILYLDEPTIGLDAVNKLAIRDFIREMNQELGTTVILTTHDMDDIEALCHRILVINDGKILSSGTLDDLRKLVSRERRLIIDLEQMASPLSEPGVKIINQNSHRVTLSFDPENRSPADLISSITRRYPVKDLFVVNPPIEEIIAEIYKNSER